MTDDAGNLSCWIEALGVDSGYRAPVKRPLKPVACFYVLSHDPENPDKQQYYRPVYLAQKTLKDLVARIAAKWNIESTRILRAIHVLPNDLEVEMDDDIVREMVEGQDVIMEVSKVAALSSLVKREWEMALDGEEEIIDSATQDDVYTEGYEIRASTVSDAGLRVGTLEVETEKVPPAAIATTLLSSSTRTILPASTSAIPGIPSTFTSASSLPSAAIPATSTPSERLSDTTMDDLQGLDNTGMPCCLVEKGGL
ncbi:hypothetical protein V502_00543 [Pseudogymnoascus sp. VKM F-4520 (FW-2644)]|nr:hypothetical protein V502_00543 [Pseudogymnoascus sp. VKM F-4520 (FW-2644)]